MDTSKDCRIVGILLLLLLYLTIAAVSFSYCDARPVRLSKGDKHGRTSIIKHIKKLKVMDLLLDQLADTANTQPYVSSPFTLPPYDSLSPMPLPENAPPFCVYPPNTPQTPSTSIPSPTGFGLPSPPLSYLPPLLPTLGPPPSPFGGVPTPTGEVPSPTSVVPSPPETFPIPNPPQIFPSPPIFVPSPTTYTPSPPGPILSPPYYEPSPPGFTPTPPYYVPSPPGFEPSPPVFLPPIVYPPPSVPPPQYRGPSTALWCVAKPSVPDPIIEEAMNYACGSGAECDSIQPNGACFRPDTLFAHASYAFNSYWQRTKVAGGTCEFGGTAMLVTVDPSYDGCHFVYY